MNKYRVTESFLMGREQNISLCEDGFIVTEDYAVMIDGAGTPSPKTFNGEKGGRYIMELIRDSIHKFQPNLDYITFLEQMNRVIVDDYKQNDWYEELTNDINLRPMASVLVYSKHKHQLWFYGDCKALVDGVQIDNPKYIDEVMLNARRMVLEAELLSGNTQDHLKENDIGREYINTLLSYQRTFLHNRGESDLAFSMVDGFDFRIEDIKVVDLPSDIHSLILTTDGYSILKPTLEETELILKEQLKKDPLAINELKGFKPLAPGANSIDDRAYLRLRF